MRAHVTDTGNISLVPESEADRFVLRLIHERGIRIAASGHMDMRITDLLIGPKGDVFTPCDSDNKEKASVARVT